MTRSTILVVDDEPTFREIVALVLEGSDYAVEFASDGQEAFARVAGGRPGAILLDLNMPRLDGVGFLARLEAAGFDDVPVIVLTASHVPLPHGADAMLEKPVDAEQLLAVLARLVPAESTSG